MSDAQIRIQIDREPYQSPAVTSGAALYALGRVAPHRDLFLEVSGAAEDQVIDRSAAELHLKAEQHFYSQKVFTIAVNAQKKEVAETKLSFDEVVKLAFPIPLDGPNIMFTIKYRKGPAVNPKGSLLEGQSVRIKDGMIFDVTPTDRS